MSKGLFVKANDRAAEQAVGVLLYHAFLTNYKDAHPSDEVVELDLFKENLTYYNATMINGMFKLMSGIGINS